MPFLSLLLNLTKSLGNKIINFLKKKKLVHLNRISLGWDKVQKLAKMIGSFGCMCIFYLFFQYGFMRVTKYYR